ncbi:hypothetical protein HYH03_002984 [Edaphochlamys debaryana]|uniref:Uncharacterized protein n=1 Tax=Edaphochlamys debaryana TaxID=47281 RepID=A0A835YAK5_9CHLO|nr:hypothetical protein HYH03_002984 [Edaphochlamys debaryana]|eukprot:KAG2499410.1 hypothetical protein HYH03_002984 [Edaphochlamys debaryana]
MLSLKLFHPAGDKVRQVEFHPVLPWVVSATKSDHVSVWDWRTKQVVWEAQLGGSDEDLSADAELARVHLRDTAFAPNPSLLHPVPGGPKREPSGKVRDVRFLDTDVAQVMLSWQHNTAAGCSTPPPRAENIRALRGQRLLLIACEAKLLVVDLVSRRVLELGRGVFEGKAPTCLAFLFRAGVHAGAGSQGGAGQHGPGGAGVGGAGGSLLPASRTGGWLLESPVVAVGCADGIVRCVQLFPVKPVVRLMSSHKTAVVAMGVLGVRGQRLEALAVGHQGGSVALFEPMGRAPSSLNEGLGPRADVKAHDGLLPGSLVLAPVMEDPETTRCLMFSAGSDHRVCGLDPITLKETTKIKVDRATLTCMAHWPRGWVASGVHSLLLGAESGHLLLAHAGSGSVRQAADLEGIVPAGGKRTPKIYGLAVHPVNPSLVAVATNTGTAIMAVAGPPPPLPALALPLASPAQAHMDDSAAAMGAAFGGAGGAGATYVTAVGASVMCVTVATLPNQEQADFPANQVMGKLTIAEPTPGGRALLASSCDGSYVSAVWPSARQYAIYRQGASSWSEVGRGTGTSVAWHPSRPIFAALEEDSLTLPPALAPAKSSRDAKKAEKLAEAARAAAEAAARAAAATAAVRIKQVSPSGGVTVVGLGMGGAVDLRGDQPAFVIGGPLLAVTVRRSVQGEAAELAPGHDSTPAAMVLYDWETARRVGPELAEPLHMAWDPSRTMLALAYPSQILVVRVRPDFQVVSTLPVTDAEALDWAQRQLFIVTPTHILTALLSPAPAQLPASSAATAAAPPSPSPPAELLVLAGPAVPCAGLGLSAGSALDGLLPPPPPRPSGPLALLGPRDGSLWLVGAVGQPMALSLGHPGLRALGLAAAGDLHGAVSLASRALSPELHDPLAGLLVRLDGLRGAAAATSLPGLSLAAELRLRVALRQWQQAVEAADALLQGFSRQPPAGTFKSAAAAAAFGSSYGGAGGWGGGRGPALGEEFVDFSQAAGGTPAIAPAHPEDLDWTQPLRAATSSARAAATASIASRPLGPSLATPSGAGTAGPGSGSAGPLAPETVGLVLGLCEDLSRAGLLDVARSLARQLLPHAVALGGEAMRALAVVMAQAGMKTDLPTLAHSVAAGAEPLGRESAALLAALLCGHTSLVQDALKDGGCSALAAMQARVFGLSTADAGWAAWRRQLAAATTPGAAAALGRLEVSLPAA